MFIVKAAFEKGFYISGIVVLLSSLLILYSVMKIFIKGFFGEAKGYKINHKLHYRGLLSVAILAVALCVVFSFAADWLYPFIKEAAVTFYDPKAYIDSVLGVK